MKEKIEQMYIQALIDDLAPNVFADQVLRLLGVGTRTFQGINGYAIEHFINETYQVVDKIDGTVYYQGSKRDCEVYLNGA
jgi:hypothetical protein